MKIDVAAVFNKVSRMVGNELFIRFTVSKRFVISYQFVSMLLSLSALRVESEI